LSGGGRGEEWEEREKREKWETWQGRLVSVHYRYSVRGRPALVRK